MRCNCVCRSALNCLLNRLRSFLSGRPVRLPNGLFKFKPGTGRARVIEDCIANINMGGADLLWIETPTPDGKSMNGVCSACILTACSSSPCIVAFMSGMMEEIRQKAPSAKLTYNNSPSFNWTLNIRKQVLADFIKNGKASEADYPNLMDCSVDNTPLGLEADRRIKYVSVRPY